MLIVGAVRRWRWLVGASQVAVCLLLAQVSLASESIHLTAHIRDSLGRPLPGAVVSVFAGSDSIPRTNLQCGDSGAVVLVLPAGVYRLSVARIDRVQWNRQLILAADTPPLDIILHEKPLLLAPIRVAAPRHKAA
jgi:hypothetical protein